MAKILDRIAETLGFLPAQSVEQRVSVMKERHRGHMRMQRRAFEAAQISRLTSSWKPSLVSVDMDLRTQLPTLVARSRDLANNNDYMRHFLRKCRTNIVGPNGVHLRFTPQTDSGELDAPDAEALAASFWDWAKKGNCDMSGQLSFQDCLNLLVTQAARDGEMLAREVMNPAVNKWGYALDLMATDRIATMRNQELEEGGVIKMGVELNRYRRPVAYHLYTKHPGDNVYATFREGMIERAPAGEIIHHFVRDDPEQTRGIPWAVSAMKRMWDLGGFEEAAIIAGRIGAAQAPWIETPDGDGEQIADDKDKDTGNLYLEAEPGVAKMLPPGAKLAQGWNPKFPDALYGPFVKAMLRGVASGVGTSYNSLANDLEGVNYSSIRQGVLEERDEWMALQEWLICGVLVRVATNWLRMALVTGAVVSKQGKPLPFTKLQKFSNFEWQGRRWSWVDPEKDVAAATAAMKARITSPQRVCAQNGVAFEDVVKELADAQKVLKLAGLPPLNLEEKSAQPPGADGKDKKPEGDKPPKDGEKARDGVSLTLNQTISAPSATTVVNEHPESADTQRTVEHGPTGDISTVRERTTFHKRKAQ
jgi:lambda family phage portal protein